MLNSLRKLRRNNMNGKYFKYAIGEIILVVIGILIALQINTWNEDRKNNKEAGLIRENLIKEFEQNRLVLAERIGTIENSIAHANFLLALMGEDHEFSSDDLDSMLVFSLYYGNFNPPNTTIQEVLQTGKSNLIKDRALMNNLSAWLAMLDDTDEDFKNQDEHANGVLSQYLTQHISNRNLDMRGIYNRVKRKSNLIENYYDEVLNDYVFENIMVDQMLWKHIMLGHYQELDSLASEILTSSKN